MRGASVGWCPYPFVDVSEHGHARVVVNGIVFLVAFAAGGLALARLAALRTGGPEPVAVPSAHAGG